MTTPSLDQASAGKDIGARPGLFSASNIVLLMVCLMYALTYIDRINVNTAGPVFQKELKLDAAQLGWVFSAFGWAYLALQVHGGWLSDRFGARKTLSVCGIVWAGATIMMGLAGGLAALIVARVILGLGEGATSPRPHGHYLTGLPPAFAGSSKESRILLPAWEMPSRRPW